MHSNLINLREVSRRTGLKRDEIIQRYQSGSFPRPIDRAISALLWFEDEIHDWIILTLEKQKGISNGKKRKGQGRIY